MNLALLDAMLNHRVLTDDPRYWWPVKARAKRLLAHSADPEALAGRMLTVLTAPMAKAA